MHRCESVCNKCKSGFIVGMELEDFLGHVHFLPYKNMCIHTDRHADTKYKELKYSGRHTHTEVRDFS